MTQFPPKRSHLSGLNFSSFNFSSSPRKSENDLREKKHWIISPKHTFSFSPPLSSSSSLRLWTYTIFLGFFGTHSTDTFCLMPCAHSYWILFYFKRKINTSRSEIYELENFSTVPTTKHREKNVQVDCKTQSTKYFTVGSTGKIIYKLNK